MVAVNWSGYPNGQIPASKMVAVEGFLFEPVTAACVRAFMLAARAAGHDIHITQGYRAIGNPSDPWNTEPVTQWSAWNAMKQGKPLPGASVVASAAPPGTSTHGDGMSADYTGTGWHPETALSEWAAEYAINYGIVFDIPTESWHGHRKFPPRISIASVDAEPVAPVQEEDEDDMATEMLWYIPAGKDSTDAAKTVKAGTAWYQRSPGDALIALGQAGDSPEYTQLYNKVYDADHPGRFYTAINGDDLLKKLIGVYGLVKTYNQVK